MAIVMHAATATIPATVTAGATAAACSRRVSAFMGPSLANYDTARHGLPCLGYTCRGLSRFAHGDRARPGAGVAAARGHPERPHPIRPIRARPARALHHPPPRR